MLDQLNSSGAKGDVIQRSPRVQRRADASHLPLLPPKMHLRASLESMYTVQNAGGYRQR